VCARARLCVRARVCVCARACVCVCARVCVCVCVVCPQSTRHPCCVTAANGDGATHRLAWSGLSGKFTLMPIELNDVPTASPSTKNCCSTPVALRSTGTGPTDPVMRGTRAWNFWSTLQYVRLVKMPVSPYSPGGTGLLSITHHEHSMHARGW
jgi:hypothetical protein